MRASFIRRWILCCFLALVVVAAVEASGAIDQDSILAKAASGTGKSTGEILGVLSLEETILRSLDEVAGPGSAANRESEKGAGDRDKAEAHDGLEVGGITEAESWRRGFDAGPNRYLVGPLPSPPSPSQDRKSEGLEDLPLCHP